MSMMNLQGKRSSKLSDLLQEAEFQGASKYGQKREVLSPKKLSTNQDPRISPEKQAKNWLRMDLDQMMESARIRRRANQSQI